MGNSESVCDCEIIHQEKVEQAKQTMLDEGLLLTVADLFKIFSDSTRVKIISVLEKNELCVCDIANILNMTKSAVSHQLKNLRETNLIKSRRLGKEVWYSLADEHIKKILDIALEHIGEIEHD
ncbi:MAG: winged helix-turn-helix transcriptional regulator [Clostridia bacterium]|nr:winged helix-turn-helix transcriptional regulator [Clostridia bacterium]